MSRFFKNTMIFVGGIAVGIGIGMAKTTQFASGSQHIRKAIKDTICDKVMDILYGNENKQPSRVSYRDRYDYRKPYYKCQCSKTPKVVDLVFETIEDAQRVLDCMDKSIDWYKAVSIADYYEFGGRSTDEHKDALYGWHDLSGACIEKHHTGGYYVSLPRPILLK